MTVGDVNPVTFTTLVQTDELAQNLANPRWCVVDCRFDLADAGRGQRAYRDGHVPGAVYAHLDRDLSGPITPASGRHPLPDATLFKQWLAASGIDRTKQVVAYDDSAGTMAVRLWWLLRWLGHEAVAVLDGGWQAWTRAGQRVETSPGTPAPAVGFDGEPIGAWVVTTQSLADALAVGDNDDLLIDVRTAARFRGESEPIDPVAGHIPGAINLPLQRHLDADGRFLSTDRLRDLYLPLLGNRSTGNVILMCGSGVTACHGLLAMEIAGLGGGRLYAGSWSEWIRDPDRAVATGD